MMTVMLMGAGNGTVGGGAIAIGLSPGSTYNFRAGAGNLTSDAITASATGGTGPYTYAWTRVSGNTYTINSPAAATTTFTTTLPAGVFRLGVYRCTATDSLGATAFADATVELESI